MSGLLWLLVASASAAEVQGRVLEKGTAAPVSSAQVVAGERTIDVDATGRFTIELPDDQPSRLTIVSADHLPQTVDLTPPLDKPLRVFLEPAPVPSEIVVEAFRPTSDMSRHRVDAEQAYETPGTYDDAVRLVQALPGVAVQREFSPTSGDLAVRGSRPGENRFLLDGIDVPYLYHFNQYASVFPASWLDTLDLYSSGFGAQFGDASGAIVDARTSATRPDDVTGTVSLNLVTAGADLTIPLPKGWSLGVAGRRSFQDLVNRGTSQYPVWPAFYDAAVRADHIDGDVSHGVFAVVAGDRYDRAVGELDTETPLEIERTPTLSYRRDWQMLGYRHRWREGRVVGGVLHDDNQGAIQGGAGAQRVRTLHIPVRVDAHGQVSPVLGWSAGGSLRSEVSWVDLQGDRQYGPEVSRESPGIAYGVDVDKTLLRTRAAAYGELSLRGGPVRILPGVRVGVDSAGPTPTIEPRLAARFRVAEQTELRIGGGRYQQRPNNLRLAVDPTLPTTNGWSFVAGLDQTIANRLEIVVEGYLHTLRRVLTDPVDGPPVVWDRGLNAGGELTLRYRIREVFFAWAYLTYGRSFLYDDIGRVPGPSDQPVSGGLVMSWNPLAALQIALRYRASSGLPFTPLSEGLYDATQDAWLPEAGRAFTARMPWYQKIDLRVAYTFTFRRWALQAALDVWIVPTKDNRALYPAWRYDYAQQDFVLGPTVLPLIGLRASF